MVIASGNGQHAYWSLSSPVGPDEAEAANRRLAHVLGADMQATDAARILRPPGSFNHKSNPPTPVAVERLEPEVFTLEQVVGKLPDPPNGRLAPGDELVRQRTSAPPEAHHDDPLAAIPPAVYVELLAGREVGRDHKAACPFHADTTPSLHAYERPSALGGTPGWKCYGCGRGGDMITFAAELWGITPRGRGYWQIRERLEAELVPALTRVAA